MYCTQLYAGCACKSIKSNLHITFKRIYCPFNKEMRGGIFQIIIFEFFSIFRKAAFRQGLY